MAASLKVGVGRENILEKAASFSMPASPKDSPNAYGPWRAVRRFVPLFFQPLVLLESRAVTSRQTADPAGCTGRPFQWEGKAGFIRQVPCYNQSPEQCRPFFFVPCAFFNSGVCPRSPLGLSGALHPPIRREDFGRPGPRSSGVGLEPAWESLGSGRSKPLGQLRGRGAFLKKGPSPPKHHKNLPSSKSLPQAAG